MRDLITNPTFDTVDLGAPMPDSPHATSVCLPLWRHVVGYEENDPQVRGKMRSGYPRFCKPAQTIELFQAVEKKMGLANESIYIWPTVTAAEAFAKLLEKATGFRPRVTPLGFKTLFTTTLPTDHLPIADKYAQRTGQIISSRLAEEALGYTPPPPPELADEARNIIKHRLAELYTPAHAEDIYLFANGMAAIHALLNCVMSLQPEQPTLQLDFPYVDVFHLQREFGHGVVHVENLDQFTIENLEAAMAERSPAAIFCELPSNSLLSSVDLRQVRDIANKYNTPLIVDDTLSTMHNTHCLRYADALVTSLTKFFSGYGDVMAGAVTLNQSSDFYPQFKNIFESSKPPAPLCAADSIVLEKNSRDFTNRMRRINRSTQSLVNYLSRRPEIERIYYPDRINPVEYNKVANGERETFYGGVFTILLRYPEKTTPAFYDALKLCKGPSFGFNFTIACPYTLLAHYHELDWVESLGVSRWLIRISVGLENYLQIREIFEDALQKLSPIINAINYNIAE